MSVSQPINHIFSSRLADEMSDFDRQSQHPASRPNTHRVIRTHACAGGTAGGATGSQQGGHGGGHPREARGGQSPEGGRGRAAQRHLQRHGIRSRHRRAAGAAPLSTYQEACLIQRKMPSYVSDWLSRQVTVQRSVSSCCHWAAGILPARELLRAPECLIISLWLGGNSRCEPGQLE